MTVQQISYQTGGDVANVALLVLTTVTSFALLYRLPDASYFDSSWLQRGFCVANPESTAWNSHSLAFYAGTLLSIALGLAYAWIYPPGRPLSSSPLQQASLRGAITGVFFHGVAHLYSGVILDPSDLELRWKSDAVGKSLMTQSIVFGALFAILRGTMALASPTKTLSYAAIFTVGVTALDVPPIMNFVYIQAVIYFCTALHMLTLESKHKQSLAYLLLALFRFPALLIGVLESTRCEELIEPLGGHVVYDTAIGLSSLLAPLLATYLESPSSTKQVKSA